MLYPGSIQHFELPGINDSIEITSRSVLSFSTLLPGAFNLGRIPPRWSCATYLESDPTLNDSIYLCAPYTPGTDSVIPYCSPSHNLLINIENRLTYPTSVTPSQITNQEIAEKLISLSEIYQLSILYKILSLSFICIIFYFFYFYHLSSFYYIFPLKIDTDAPIFPNYSIFHIFVLWKERHPQLNEATIVELFNQNFSGIASRTRKRLKSVHAGISYHIPNFIILEKTHLKKLYGPLFERFNFFNEVSVSSVIASSSLTVASSASASSFSSSFPTSSSSSSTSAPSSFSSSSLSRPLELE